MLQESTSKIFLFIFLQFYALVLYAQPAALDHYNEVWTSQSANSGASMPCGGGDIGLNVWVEKGELFFYHSRSGSFDENNALLKSGRIRINLSPNPFDGVHFRQELDLKNGNISIDGANGKLQARVKIWVDVFHPVVHVEIKSSQPVMATAIYENWRYRDRPLTGRANNANSWKWIPRPNAKTSKDEIDIKENGIRFYHRNQGENIFDVTVHEQGMDSVKQEMFDPLKDLIFGGRMEGKGMVAGTAVTGTYQDTDYKGWPLHSRKNAKEHSLDIYLHTAQTPDISGWEEGLRNTITAAKKEQKDAWTKTKAWWNDFWNRSYIFIGADSKKDTALSWQAGKNYQLFRYMLGCNAFGTYPTKFNGGLFTYDPSLTDTALKYTPDFRNWGGGTHTAQNQRLVYFPMIKAGDADLMKPQFDFYLRCLKNAELRSKTYWHHDGACFTEQMENFGLPNPAEYGWTRPADFDPGVEYNAWLEYLWDTSLEFCLMILETERYFKKDISGYIPLIESCLRFFDQHYQFLAEKRGRKKLDGAGHLVLYPGSGAETFKMAYNSTSTIAALQTVTRRMLELPEPYLGAAKRKSLDSFLQRIPPISFAEFNGKKTLAPAKTWERINNVESPQLYPVFPWGMYGIGKPDLDVALNTWNLDTNVIKFRSPIGWKQDNIFAARLGLTAEAAALTTAKLKNSGRRFPAFWGPGFDWTPDHNWGGSGMIGLQEMLLQTDGKKIFLFPAWPKTWNVQFKLHAPYDTVVEGVVKDGKVQSLQVTPASRKNDVVNMF
jgi:hypothetical protein